MKKILLLSSLLITTVMLNAQTIDAVMTKYTEAVGKTADVAKIKTMKLTGMLTIQGMELPLTQQIIRGRAVKTTVPVMGTEVVMAYLDGKGWKVNQFAGAPEPVAMDAGELEATKGQTSVISPLYDAKSNSEKLELAGEETVNGEKAWKIKTTATNGKTITWYISTTTNDIIKSIGKEALNGQEMEIETVYADYKTVEGIRLPFSISNSTGGQVYQAIRVDKYELNPVVDEKDFAMPK